MPRDYYFFRDEEQTLLDRMAIERAALFARCPLTRPVPDSERHLLHCITAVQTALENTEAERSKIMLNFGAAVQEKTA